MEKKKIETYDDFKMAIEGVKGYRSLCDLHESDPVRYSGFKERYETEKLKEKK